MFSKFKYLYYTTFVVLFSICVNQSHADPRFNFNIQTQYEHNPHMTEVRFIPVVENLTTDTIYSGRFGLLENFKLRTKVEGEEIILSKRHHSNTKFPYKFPPNSTVMGNVTSQSFTNSTPSRLADQFKWAYLPVGEHTFYGEIDVQIGREVVKSYAECNFEVVEPQGRDKEARDKFLNAIEFRLSDPDSSKSLHLDLLNNYSDTRYIEDAFQSYITSISMWDIRNSMEPRLKWSRWFLENYPDSDISPLQTAVYGISLAHQYLSDKVTALDELKEYRSAFGENTELNRLITKRINDISEMSGQQFKQTFSK